MNIVVAETFTHLIKVIAKEFNEQQQIAEKSLSMLSFMFDLTAVQALDLVDKKCISHIVSPSGRELYLVQRNISKFHICLKNSNYCTCASFTFHVLKKSQYMCKHKLAAILSTAMGLCKEVQYSDETVALMLIGQ